ncbi:MAG: hypothetical protein QG602_686 [Verrucomicrobiota bacterium]|nr:hypothetical protein [Verrucomicrobiota bacterium]
MAKQPRHCSMTLCCSRRGSETPPCSKIGPSLKSRSRGVRFAGHKKGPAIMPGLKVKRMFPVDQGFAALNVAMKSAVTSRSALV